jgi:hypothetical protein
MEAKKRATSAVGKTLQRLQVGEECDTATPNIRAKIFSAQFVEFRSRRSSS